MKITNLFLFLLMISAMAFAFTIMPVDIVINNTGSGTATLKVIAVDSGPAGYSTTSVSGVKIYLRDPSNGATLDSGTTNSNGVTFNVKLNAQFYVTTSGSIGSALGGTYGFYQELDGDGVPSFKITKQGSTYALCRLSDNSCSYSSILSIVLFFTLR